MDDEQKILKAQKRIEMIMMVRSGQMTATDAAKELGISRQMYYKIENKALQAIIRETIDGEAGRPKNTVDPEKEKLQSQIEELQKQVLFLEQTHKIRDMKEDLLKTEHEQEIEELKKLRIEERRAKRNKRKKKRNK